jgi:hypothetical protein
MSRSTLDLAYRDAQRDLLEERARKWDRRVKDSLAIDTLEREAEAWVALTKGAVKAARAARRAATLHRRASASRDFLEFDIATEAEKDYRDAEREALKPYLEVLQK